MARRKKATRRRSPKTISLLNIAESYAYASVLTGGVLANSPVGVLGFDGSGAAGGAGYGMTTTNGAMTLSSIVSDPGSSFDSMSANFMANYQAMAVSAIGIGITFKFAKKLLRKPIANVNRNLLKPIGIGVRL
jgi:phosphosulfolactate phosphohydrolase-like enzyme|tara:strand:- start:65 stop:463 length:399 start_codon:yes stop_codon:yes gene_type:complete